MCSRDSRAKDPFYSRKEKSLGLLCTNFLGLYNRDGVESIGLDDAASQLGVERRRIYDIVNILESLWVLERKGKSQYAWKGFSAIPEALKFLKVSNKEECGPASQSKTELQEKYLESDKEHKREKSLALLAQNFTKLFICSDVDLISLDRASLALLGNVHDPKAMRTKVRRLYDIANVFSSMGLLEKTRDLDSGKPAFRWIGVARDRTRGSSIALDAKNPKKREFGKDITNTVVKRSNTGASFDWDSNDLVNKGKCLEDKLKGANDGLSTEKHQKNSRKTFVFGPFTPNATSSADHGNQNSGQIQDLESLPCVSQLEYSNQAIYGLFQHYAEAWKTWHVEAENKQETEPGS